MQLLVQTFENDESTQCKVSLAPTRSIESFKTKLNASETQLNENYQMISADIMYWNDFTERVDTMLCYLDSQMELINEDNTLDVDQIAEKLKAREVRQLLLPYFLTLYAPTPQNGQTHSNNSSAVADEFF